MPNGTIPLVVIGAGPYGLALSAQCGQLGIDHVLLGEPMSFWRDNMPAGMLLRSRPGWHLDPLETLTIERYATERGLAAAELDPIALSRYLDYAEWFQRERGVIADPRHVVRLDRLDSPPARFEVTLTGGDRLAAENVVVATGMGACAHVPPEIAALLPAGRFEHSVRLVDFAGLAGKTCLIVGGRQSAFEWAALAAESGVERVHVSYRHATPRFAEADWGWVDPLLARFDTEPRWYHELPAAGREEITRHMWRIGREQLEPWLAPRIDRPEVSLWPDSRPARAYSDVDGRSLVILDNGTELVVDMVLLATGYRMDVNRLPFLTAGSSLGGVDVVDGFPVLDERFSSSVPGLYFTNRFATRDFGHFFDFTAGVRVSARTIASSILAGVPEAAR